MDSGFGGNFEFRVADCRMLIIDVSELRVRVMAGRYQCSPIVSKRHGPSSKELGMSRNSPAQLPGSACPDPGR